MSTTINVSIGDGGLPERNRQQTAANRQAYVQNKASEQAAEGGVLALRAQRIAEGRDPLTGGQLIPGSGSRLQRLDQQPAANRQKTGIGCLLLPSQDFVLSPSNPFPVEYPDEYSVAPALVRGYANNLWWTPTVIYPPNIRPNIRLIKENDYITPSGVIDNTELDPPGINTEGFVVHAVAAGSDIVYSSGYEDGFGYLNTPGPLRPANVSMSSFTYEALVRFTDYSRITFGLANITQPGWGAVATMLEIDGFITISALTPNSGDNINVFGDYASSSFQHLAIVYSSGYCNFYLAGNRIGTISVDPPPSSEVYILRADLFYNRLGSNPTPSLLPAIKNIRFTPGRALYRGPSFTPPTSITKLA